MVSNIATAKYPVLQNDFALEGSYTLFADKWIKLGWKRLIVIRCSDGSGTVLRQLLKKIQVPHVPIIITVSDYGNFYSENRSWIHNSVVNLQNNQVLIGSTKYLLENDSAICIHPDTNLVNLHRQQHRNHFFMRRDDVFVSLANQLGERFFGVFLGEITGIGTIELKNILNRGCEVWIHQPENVSSKCPTGYQPLNRGMVSRIGDRINNLTKIHMQYVDI